jgi:hypothetical protein
MRTLHIAPGDYFYDMILAQARPDWLKVARIVGGTMSANCEPYYQVGDMMLLMRVKALVEKGKLVAEGELLDMRCRVRLGG